MKSILITGAGKGLGRALLQEFWQEGYYVYPLVRQDVHKAHIEQAYTERCTPIVSDVSHTACGARIEQAVSEHTGILNIVINNAGIPGTGHKIEEVQLDDILLGFKVHCLGALNVSKACLPYLRKSELGKVVNISSRLGSLTKMSDGEFKHRKFSYSYRIGKAAQNMLTVCLNNELSLNNEPVGVIAIHPGLVKTENSARDAYELPADAAHRLRRYIEGIKKEDFGTYQNPGQGAFPW